MKGFARTPNYYPALVAVISLAMKEEIKRISDDSDGKITKLLNFYTNEVDSYFYHPYVLFSGAHHYKIKDFHKNYRIGKDTSLFVDSGGYQVATGVMKDKKYDADLIYNWAKDVAKANILPILDNPLKADSIFKDHLSFTSNNAKHFADRKAFDEKNGNINHDFNILNIVQGNNANHITDWYDEVKQYKLDGWAHGGHDRKMKPVITTLMHLWQNGEFKREKTIPYHIFGTGSIDNWLYIAYMQMKFNQKGVDIQLSADNSNANFASANGMFMAPVKTHTESYVRLKLNRKENLEKKLAKLEALEDGTPGKAKDLAKVKQEIIDYDFDFKNAEKVPMFCDCVACSLCDSMNDLIENSRLYYLIITLHNIISNIRIKKQIDSLVFIGIPEVYPEMFLQKVVNNFKVIDSVFENPKKANSIMSMFTESAVKKKENIETSLDGWT